MAQTTIAVDVTTRDALRALSARLGTASMDDALRTLLWEHECSESLARLDADPALAASYHDEAQALAEVDVMVVEA